MRIVFFNISYMNFYKGKENDNIAGDFRYVKEKEIVGKSTILLH